MKVRLDAGISYFNDFIKHKNEAKKTKKSLALEIDRTENYVSRLSNGKTPVIDIETIPKICKSLGIDANFLFNINSTLSDNHKVVIRTALRMLFDYQNITKDDMGKIIDLYLMFNLGNDFIEEVKNDYYQEFGEHY